MKVRFQADADLNLAIVKATLRREPDIDFQTAHVAGLSGLYDRDVLALAAQAGRLLITHDRKTMPRHFADFIMQKTSSGLLVVSQKLPIRVVVDDLLLIWETSDAEEWINQIQSLPL